MANLPLGPIFDASNVTLDQQPGTLPNVSDALSSWFQAMTFGVLTKTLVNFKTVETPVSTVFYGMWQPTDQKLAIDASGERAWKTATVYALPTPFLNPDDVLLYQGVQYRVLDKRDWTQHGYIQYSLIQDYTGSGPGTY